MRARRRPARRHLRMRLLAAIGALGALLLAPLSSAWTFGGHPARADSGSSAPAFTKTESIVRSHLTAGGQEKPAGSQTFTLTVDKTTGLRNLDGLNVAWSGAHPSTNIAPDYNSDQGKYDSYPVVLLECRGTDSPPNGETQLTPQTCWTDAADERSALASQTDFPPWRLDRYAAAPDGARPPQFLGVPSAAACDIDPTATEAAYDIPIYGVDDAKYDAAGWSFNGCGTLAAEEQVTGYPQGAPDNLTWGITGADGTGSATFRAWTNDTNATLGCSSTIPCSLVAVPIFGISCNESAAPEMDGSIPTSAEVSACEDSTSAIGKLQGISGSGDTAIDGELWWSPSNWRNHITVPLTFNPPAATCTNATSGTVYAFGSELMDQVAPQWAAEFCTDPSKTPFQAVAAPEPQAASQLASGQIEAALVTNPPPPSSTTVPIVTAPVAVSGFAIAVDIDDANGKPVSGVRLDARLLAKLLTGSYHDNLFGAFDPNIANNPANISDDPEFQALNPGLYLSVDDPASTLLTLSTQSDVMYALTSYINADPEARAWLDGTPDPWGMVVDPPYKGIALPTSIWPLLDTFIPYVTDPLTGEQFPYTTADTVCLHYVYTPFQQLVASPVTRLSLIVPNMLAHQGNTHFACNGFDTNTVGLNPPEIPGKEFIVGTVALADAARYGLTVAQLETQSSSSATGKFTDGTGRTFVGPSDASLQAAADLLKPDDDTGTWDFDYSNLRTNPAGAAAYPGTMLISLSVPTSGLPPADAKAYSQILQYAAGDGQTEGTGNGQLPPGYLPLTAAKGLGALVDYTKQAASVVASQQGAALMPSPSPSACPSGSGVQTLSPSSTACPTPCPSASPVPSGCPTLTPSPSLSSTPSPSSSTAPAPTPAPSISGAPAVVRPVVANPVSRTTAPAPAPTTATPAVTASPQPSASASAAASPSVALAAARTPAQGVGRLGFLLPLLLVVAAGCGTLALVVEALADVRMRH